MNSKNDDSASPSSGEPEPPFCSSSDATQSTTRASNATHKRNAGRKKFRETRHPVYRGVRQRNGQKWVCEVREPNKKSRIWLGTFPSPEMAARAYDVATLALRGNSAPLNFPDSAWSLPRAESSSARDIRLAVVEATKSDRLISPSSSSSNVELLDPETPRNVLGASNDSKKFPEHSETLFFDEEVLFNMPVLLDSMAEGLLITPPGMQKRMDPDDMYSDMELSLWND